MLLDVLSGLEKLNICTAYRIEGKQTSAFPSHVEDLRQAEPVYETLPGWQEEIDDCRSFGKLPANAQAYLRRISELIGQPIAMVSVGRERDQTIVVSK
jgi:adenylosuccinate synthase